MESKYTAKGIDIFLKRCKEHGFKITPQRSIIYEKIVQAKDHPSLDSIYKKVRKILPHVSFDTVYRTILSFMELGLVKEVEGYGGSKRFDPNTGPHHHFRCIKCHRIIDFYNPVFNDLKVPDDIKIKFTVLEKKVLLEGLCDKCNKTI